MHHRHGQQPLGKEELPSVFKPLAVGDIYKADGDYHYAARGVEDIGEAVAHAEC